jgi:hypothetical protein
MIPDSRLAHQPPPELAPTRLKLHPSHKVRSSDASRFDFVCERCGHTDTVPGGWGKLAYPCPRS